MERDVATAMTGQDMVQMYQPLLAIIYRSIQAAEQSWAQIGQPIPTLQELEDSFFFLLSRMSHLRLIPLADLANAALPDEVAHSQPFVHRGI